MIRLKLPICALLIAGLTLASANASVTFVTNDIATDFAWRTPSVVKDTDIDGDNVYGSAGYFLPSAKQFGYRNPLLVGTNVITPDPKGVNALPAYITSLEFTNAEVGSSWGGEFSDDGTMDLVPGSIGLTGAGILPSLAGTNVLYLKLKRGTSPAFRLTLIFGNNPNPLTTFELSAISENTSVTGNAGIPGSDDPLGMNVTLNDGSGAVTQMSGDASLAGKTVGYTTYQSWDISAGNSDIDITIDLTGSTSVVPRLSGIAIDSLPITLPTVLIPPASGTYFQGNPIVLTVNAGGTGIGYQWLKNSNNIVGANFDTLTITNSVTTNSGAYQVVITNSVGSVTSIVATVTVQAPPVTVIYQDTLGGAAAALNGRVPDTTGTTPWTAAATWNTDGTQAAATTTGLAFLPFTPQAGRIYTLSADIENFDTTGNDWTALGFANGSTVNGQWHTAGNNPVGWFLARGDNTVVNQAFIGPNTANGQAFNYAPTTLTSYQIIFDTTPASPANWTFTYLANGTIYRPATIFGGSGPTITTVGFGNQGGHVGHIMNFKLSQQVPFKAPFVTLQPVGGTNFLGDTKTFTVQVGGSDPLSFQWQKNSNNIANATNLVLTLTNLQTANSGSYRVVVTNPLGTTNSVGVSLLVIAPVAGTIYQDAFTGAGNLNGRLPDTVGVSTWIAGTNNAWTTDGTQAIKNSAGSANAFLPFVPQAGNVYTLSVDMDSLATDWLAMGFANGSSTDITFQNSPNNPVGWSLARPDGSLADNQTFLGTGTGGGAGTGFLPAGGFHNYAVVLDTRPSPANWTFTWLMDSNIVRGPSAFGGSGPAISTVAMGGTGASSGNMQNFKLTVFASSSNAPVILTQPVGGLFLAGSQANLAAYAGGSSLLSYQWQKNSNNITGATFPQLVLTNLSSSDSGFYRLVVTNALGTAASSNALVTVLTNIPALTFDAGDVLPSIPVNTNNDLIIFSLASVSPAASGNNFTGLIMRNGTTGTAFENTTQNPGNVMNAGTYDFIFDTSVNTNGYDLTSVVTYSGWTDRAGQNHTVYYRLKGSSTFVALSTVVDTAPGGGSLRAEVPAYLSGVDAIRIVVNQTFFVYREIAVYGVPFGTAAPGPTLTIKSQSGSVLVSWSAAVIGYGLTGSSVLGAGASWQPIGGTPTVVNGTYQVTIPTTNSAQFYRLVK